MKPMYSTEISIREARDFLTAYISDRARIPHGSRCLWVAGVRFVTDQPGCYLRAGVGGLEGVVIVAPVVARVGEKTA